MCLNEVGYYGLYQLGVDGEDHIRVGKLNLVDLAGSERQSKTGTTVRSCDHNNDIIV